MIYNKEDKVKSEWLEYETTKQNIKPLHESSLNFEKVTKDSSSVHHSQKSTRLQLDKHQTSKQISFKKQHQITKLAVELDGIVSRDELEESSIIHKSFDKVQSRLSINDYPKLLNNRVQTSDNAFNQGQRQNSLGRHRAFKQQNNQQNNGAGSILTTFRNPVLSDDPYTTTNQRAYTKNEQCQSGQIYVKRMLNPNSSDQRSQVSNSQENSRDGTPSRRMLGFARSQVFKQSFQTNRIRDMRAQAFNDQVESVRQSSAFNHYIKEKIMSKDQVNESQRSSVFTSQRTKSFNQKNLTNRTNIHRQVKAKQDLAIDLDKDDSSNEDKQVVFDIKKSSYPLDYKQSNDTLFKMKQDLEHHHHGEELQQKIKVFRDSDFWYHKGITTGKKDELETAIDCYKQALRLNHDHYPSIFNLACSYEKIKKHSSALKHFEHLISIKPEWAEAYYGACLSSFKLGKYEHALQRINKAIELVADPKFQNKNAYVYMKAVCLKKLKRYDDCQATYKLLHDIIMRTENQEIVKYVFGIVLLPFQNDRRLISDYVENFENLMDFYEPKNTIPDPICPFYIQNDGWLTDKIDTVIGKIKDRSFFRRFNKIQLKQFMKFMKVKRYNTDEIIFVEDQVVVVLDGIVHMKSHSENVLPPKLMAKYQQGDVIGYRQSDMGVSNKVETWCLAKSPTEIAIFEPENFDFIWNQHRHNQNDMLVNILKTHSFFNFLSDQTINLLAFELIKVRKFPPNHTIMTQSKRSPLNFYYREFFENRMSDLQLALIDQRKKLKQQDEDAEIGAYTFMMQKLHKTVTQKQKERELKLQAMNPGYQKEVIAASPVKTKESNPTQADEEYLEDIDEDDPSTPEYKKKEREELKLLKTSVDNAGEYSSLINDIKESESDGIYIIDTGRCKIVNPYDQYLNATISRGDFFGESQELKVPSINYYGDVIAVEKEVTCLFISKKDFLRIPIYEMEKIRDMCLKKQQALQYTASKKYGISMEELSKY